MNTSLKLRLTAALTMLVAAVALAACGSSSDSTTTSASGGETVATASVGSAGDVLVGADGRTLYTPAQEASGKIECVGSCAKIWIPVTSTGAPTAAPEVGAKLTTIKRPDGTMQVAADGAPLYTFSEDTGAGSANGNGVSDSFNGKSFTWAVIPTGNGSAGTGSTPPSTTTTQGSSGYSY